MSYGPQLPDTIKAEALVRYPEKGRWTRAGHLPSPRWRRFAAHRQAVVVVVRRASARPPKATTPLQPAGNSNNDKRVKGKAVAVIHVGLFAFCSLPRGPVIGPNGFVVMK